MNWSLLVPLLITAMVTIVGWHISHRFAVRRDLVNKRRELRTRYLIDAYRRLMKSSNHPRLYEVGDEVSGAIADIQMFGNNEQATLAKKFVFEMAEKRTASLDELLISLRDEFRREFLLPELQGRLCWLRIDRDEAD